MYCWVLVFALFTFWSWFWCSRRWCIDKLGVFHETKPLCVLIHIWTKGEVGPLWNRFKLSSKIFLLTVPRRFFFCGSFMLFLSCVCHAFASVHCCLVVTWTERVDLLAPVCDVYCDFVTFLFGILGQVWYLIVSIPGPCCLSYLHSKLLPAFLTRNEKKSKYFIKLLTLIRLLPQGKSHLQCVFTDIIIISPVCCDKQLNLGVKSHWYLKKSNLQFESNNLK